MATTRYMKEREKKSSGIGGFVGAFLLGLLLGLVIGGATAIIVGIIVGALAGYFGGVLFSRYIIDPLSKWFSHEEQPPHSAEPTDTYTFLRNQNLHEGVRSSASETTEVRQRLSQIISESDKEVDKKSLPELDVSFELDRRFK